MKEFIELVVITLGAAAVFLGAATLITEIWM